MKTEFKEAKPLSLAHLSDYTADKVVVTEIMENANGSIVMVTLKQGLTIPQHPAPADVMVQVVEGKVEFTVDTTDVQFHTGDFMLLKEGRLHSVKALTDVKILLTKIRP